MKQKKRLVADILNISPKKVKFMPEAMADVQKAITRADMRGLLAVKKIVERQVSGHSRARARKLLLQKRKGRKKGRGTRKGPAFSQLTKKDRWKSRIRVQRKFLRNLHDKQLLDPHTYRVLYAKSKGGYFRNIRHMKLYLEEQQMFKKKQSE
ncbi:50S ribosomal protein L19e [Candidatus Woesearchaeota archaeon]|nr:50S ribosomal protein L19e [Candidatus Woesearchaeota archaeon]